MNKFVWLFLSLWIVSCSTNVENSKRIYIKEFPKNVKVKFQKIEVEPILYFIGDMQIVDDVLVTLDMKNDIYFQFFQLPDLAYLGAQVKRGEGPEEEIAVFPFIFNMGRGVFAYRSLYEVKMGYYDKELKKFHTTKIIKLPIEYMNIMNCLVTMDAIYGYSMLEKSKKEYRKFNFNDDNDEITDFGPSFPDVNMEINKDRENTVFTKIMAAKTDGDRFAALYDKFPLLRICNKDGEVVSEIEYENGQKSPVAYMNAGIHSSDFNDYTINYMKIKVTDKYIYGLYSGKTHKDLNTEETKTGDYCSEVHIWNWDGKAVARLILPENVSAFAVEPNDTYILFSSFIHDDELYKIDITTIF